jgi:ParB-like nuclease domain
MRRRSFRPNGSSGPHGPSPRSTGSLGIEYLRGEDLQPYQNNARHHPATQLDKLVTSIRDFGFLVPIIVDHENIVIAGHARLEAAKRLSLRTVPCIRAAHLTEPQKRAFTILDNRLAQDAKWDFEALAKEFEFLQGQNIDIATTGFELPEIEMILDSGAQQSPASEDDPLPNLVTNRVCSKLGDIWALGDHRLLCGDARHRESFEALLQGERAQLVFVDPPYNVPIRGHVSGKGRIRHREFAQASGEKTSAQYTKFLEECLGHLAEHSQDGSIHFVCADWRHLDENLTAGKRTYRELKNLVVWAKTNAGMGTFYRPT